MSAPLVSVIIPTFNRARLLRRAITSVIYQTFSDWELIVVDDGSTDNTSSVCRDFQHRLPGRFRYIAAENNGAAAARNRGVLAARGRYVAFLDSDDVFVSMKLAIQLAKMEASQARFSFTNHFFFNDHGEIIDRARDFSLMDADDIYPKLLMAKYNSISTPTVVLDKLTFFRSGGFSVEMETCEDIDLWFRILKDERPEILLESLSGVHLRSGESIDYEKVLQSRALLYERSFSCDPALDVVFARELVDEIMHILIHGAKASELTMMEQKLKAALARLSCVESSEDAFNLMRETAKITLPTRRRGASA